MGDYQCCILADQKGNAWEFSKQVYESIKRRDGGEKFDLVEINFKRFRDGELFLDISKNIRRSNCYFIHDSSKNPSDWFNELVFVNHTLRNSSCQEIIDVLPYLRYSRQDRKDKSRTPISAKVIADIIGLYADKVLTLDVHNPSIQSAYNIPFDYLYSFPTVIEYIEKKHQNFMKNIVVMSPDTGGSKRAESFAKRVHVKDVGIAIGYKTRKKAGEVDGLKIVGDVMDKNVLIIDDIVDSGNTLIKARETLMKEGAKEVAAYCTHALFTEGAEKVVSGFEFFVVGDSVVNPSFKNLKNIEVVSFTELFAEAIYRVNEGKSLSDLLEEPVS